MKLNETRSQGAADTQRRAEGEKASYLEDSFDRDTDYITDRIVADPATAEPKSDGELWPVEPGRYRLVVARACPWANRAVIVRRLLGLEDAISLAIAGPVHDWRSWTFDLDPDGRDPVLGIERLREAYLTRFPEYPKGITVPAMVEVETGRVVTNDFWSMTEDFVTEWTAHHRDGAPALYPARLRDEIDEMSMSFYEDVNNGVYKSGFAKSQGAHERAYTALFDRLDELEAHLADRRYLVGDHVTLADVRLWTTLARFDAVYHNHFKTNQPQQADRDAGAVGLCPRPLPDTGVRGHDRLRAGQAALLPDPRGRESDRRGAGGPGRQRVARDPRPGSARRQPVRRRHRTRCAAPGRARPGRQQLDPRRGRPTARRLTPRPALSRARPVR